MKLLILTTAVAAALAVSPDASAAPPLETAIFDGVFVSASSATALDRATDAGATAVRIILHWSSVAPTGTAAPVGFDATNPADPRYKWSSFDTHMRRAKERGLEPILSIMNSPAWATVPAVAGGQATLPDPVELSKFALAAARRYSGTFGAPALPRIRYWQVWNEPNISLFFKPQFVNGQPFAPGWYRTMVNETAAAVKSVHADNLVIAGGTAPFYDNTPEVVAIDPNWGPLSFLREVLCLSASLTSKCAGTARFDVWAHHPYTSGGPTRRAIRPNDVSLGDLPELRAMLNAAQQAGKIIASDPVRLWVTEFSWDSNGPDPHGVPEPLLSRWTSESLYRMWQSGVSLVTWFLLRDFVPADPYQSGLYFRGSDLAGDTPKPVLQAFRFPFVAFARRHKVAVWGRTPGGRPANVLVEQSFQGGWHVLGTVPTDANGILEATFETTASGSVRARTTDLGEQAVAFSLSPVPDQIFHPFGGGALEQIPPPTRPALPPRATFDSSRRAHIQEGLEVTE